MIDVQGIEITHPHKVTYPHPDITKVEVARYYAKIAPTLLPHVKGRPLTLRIYPQGIDEDGFYNKNAPDHFPDFIKRISVPLRSKEDKDKTLMASANQEKDLIFFANQNVIELHMGLSLQDALEKPDQIIFDFDPSDDDFEKVRACAFYLKELLDTHDITSFVKTTGSSGLHVHIPLRIDKTFEGVKEVARNVAEKLQAQYPDLMTLEQRKGKRKDKVFIDILRNDYGMTAIVPYSLRALKKAPVATPLAWEELKDRDVSAQSYTLSNIFRRLAQKNDPWQDFTRHRIKLDTIKGLL